MKLKIGGFPWESQQMKKLNDKKIFTGSICKNISSKADEAWLVDFVLYRDIRYCTNETVDVTPHKRPLQLLLSLSRDFLHGRMSDHNKTL